MLRACSCMGLAEPYPASWHAAVCQMPHGSRACTSVSASSRPRYWAAHMASHLLVDIRVSLYDGMAPGLIPLNRCVHQAHAKADIEHIAMASRSRADGLQDQDCSLQQQGGQASASSSGALDGVHRPTGGWANGQ